MEIQHPLHQHPLKLVPMGSEEDDDDQTQKGACAGCDNVLSGEVYACDSCRLYLHQSCADLPLRIAHLIHPGCTLFLKLVPDSEDGGEPQGMMLWYRCEACNFGIDAACGRQFLQNNRSKEVEDATPSSKGKDDAEPSSEEVGDAELKYCRVCDKLISESHNDRHSAYEYFFHKSCVVTHLPRKIQHFFHHCTLFLSLREGKVCSTCKSDDDVFIYHCKKCNYSMHERCAMFQPVSRQDEGKRVQHWSHRHPLKFSEKEEVLGRTLECGVCRRKISWQSDFAACEPCDFHIHESCMSLPLEIQHRCHPDNLWLQHNTNPHFCNTCLSVVDDFHYKCKKCIFRMHLNCVYSSREVGQVDKVEHILHFCHHHPLQLFNDPKKEKTDILKRRRLECLVCECSASGLTFGCKDCDVYLHKSCLDILPQTVRVADVSLFLCKGKDVRCTKCWKLFSGFHFRDMTITKSETMWCVPCALLKALSLRVVSPSYIFSQLHFHPCTLTLKLFPTFTCNGCFTHCHTNAWYCDQCDFYVGIECAQISMRDSSEDGKEWIQHFCHWHPLQVSQDLEEDSTTSCKICGDPCTPRPFYFCSDCDFHIHKSCLDMLPQKIDKHYFNCSLVLLTTSYYRCIACQKDNNSGLAFRSIQSGFKLCMKCVIWPENRQNDDGTFTSVHHWHHLTFVDKSEKDANCLLCRSNVSTSTYYCSECKDYFHNACAELPVEMQHPLHKQHPLALTSGHLLRESSRNCSLCEGDLLVNDPESRHSGVYHCKECGFQLDKKCFTSFPSIQYQGHSHLLTVVEDMQGQEDCQVCKKSCTNKMVFRCAEVKCEFSLHLSCGPLPCTIKHSCHVHPLILEEFYVEENYTDLFPCHFCEERRDPRLPVYRCGEGCPMICEIKCVISEVLPKLLGAHGEVELRTTFPNVASKVITKDEGLIDIAYGSDTRFTCALQFLLDGPINSDIMSVIKNWEGIMIGSRGTELELETDEMFTFSKEAFSQFSSKLECTQFTLEREGIPDFISQHSGSVGRGEHILLPDTLIPIYEEWFGKFRRVISNSFKYDRYESVFVFMLCAVFHDMRTTKLVDVTNERVLQWVTLLKLVEESGCTIGFISDKIKCVWEAHFLIKAKAIVDDKSARLDRRHKELSRREEELLRELKEVRKEKEEVNKEEQVHHKYAGDGMRSLRKEYADALLIKWKPATVVLSDCKHQLRDKLEFRGSKNVEELSPNIYPKLGIYDLEKGTYKLVKSASSRVSFHKI